MSWKSKTYDVQLPALAIRGPELRQSLRVFTIATLFLTAHGVCISGAHINSFCRMIGFTDFHMGLLVSLPPLAVIAQILATLPIERTGLRKHQFIQCSVFARLGWFAMVGVALLLPIPSTTAVWLVLAVYVSISFLDSFAGPAGTTWAGDILPRRIRARYVATQQTFTRLLTLVLLVGVSLLLDWATRPMAGDKQVVTVQNQPELFRTILYLFTAAGALGLGMLLYHRVREILPPIADRVSNPLADDRSRTPRDDLPTGVIEAILKVLIDPLRNRTFRKLALCVTVLNFGANVGGIYLWEHCGPRNLGFSNLATNMIFMFGGTLASLLTLKPLGKMVDRFGRKPVLVVCAFATTMGIWPWAFITKGMGDMGLPAALNWLCQSVGGLFGHGDFILLEPGLPVAAWVIGMATASFAGIAWAGVGLAQQNYIFAFSDMAGRSRFVAAFAVITTLGAIVAGPIGGWVTQSLQFLQEHPLVLGPIVLNNWQVSFLIGGTARFVAAIMLLRLPDEGMRTPGDLLNHMAGWLPRMVTRVFPFGGR